ncbi:MAG TPA: zinc-ribbon and DUF3426 domain-containing protein [Burkholderiales bacterium]|jgi:predicted Zn finger-like uncharacterized protein
MITQCPACGTHFRVAPEQLQVHQGQVRCGRCMTVFDGLRALAALSETAPDAAAGNVGEAGAFRLEPVEPAQTAAPQGAPARAPEAEAAGKEYGPEPEQLSLDEELFADPAQMRRDRLWAVGAALLVLVLVGQAAYFYRAELAVNYPALKPYLVKLCDVIQCKVLPPQRPRLIAIEASDLQATDPKRPGVIQLTATLRNHAGHDLGYPALDLVLTNTKEHTLARRVFLPKEYLERGKDIASGLPANAEITVRLDLDTGDLSPAGFRLDLLPAPPP